MKNLILILIILLSHLSYAQSTPVFSYSTGAYIQHYKGNLGSSFFKFNTTCFAGWSNSLNARISPAISIDVAVSIGDFGYCQTSEDRIRTQEYSYKCPGCADKLGMGELRSRMISENVALKYHLDNNKILNSDSKLAPYISAGIGLNQLFDRMKRDCVNEGLHLSINAGTGVQFKLSDKLSVAYEVNAARFINDKVYASYSPETNAISLDALDIQLDKTKDHFLRNAFIISFTL